MCLNSPGQHKVRVQAHGGGWPMTVAEGAKGRRVKGLTAWSWKSPPVEGILNSAGRLHSDWG